MSTPESLAITDSREGLQQGLTVAGPRKPIDSFDKLGGKETVVVGRVELEPPLHEHDQRLRGPMSGKFENKMFMMVESE